jgi:hypothetical protein
MMEVVQIYETSVFLYDTTRHYIQEHCHTEMNTII